MKRVMLIYQIIRQRYGDAFPIDQVLEITRIYRQKPLPQPVVLPPGVLRPDATGCVLPFPDTDLICLQPGLSTILTTITILHECGHLLCGHVKHVSPDLPAHNGQHLKEYMSRSICRDHFNIIDRDIEAEADSFAVLVYPHISRYGSSLSPAAWDLF